MPGSGATPLPRLRLALEHAVRARGLRVVAREIGLDHKAVANIIGGSTPRMSTRHRIEQWYVRCAAHQRTDVDAEALAAALQLLVNEVPSSNRQRARRELATAIGDILRRYGGREPDWTREGPEVTEPET
jgi:hypothetical protein